MNMECLFASLAGCTLTKSEWDEGLSGRTELGGDLRVVFNIDRLIECVTRLAGLGEEHVEDEIFRVAKTMKRIKSLQTQLDVLKKRIGRNSIGV